MNKIYIIGPVGSGKTTLARKLSKQLNIKFYELDKVVWDDDNGNIKRSVEEINSLFNNIINQESWIIEDVGRNCFKKGRDKADVVYYLKLKPITIYYRIIKRWIKQKIGIEKYNYKPTIKSLIELLNWVKSDLKNQKLKIKELEKYNLIILKK